MPWSGYAVHVGYFSWFSFGTVGFFWSWSSFDWHHHDIHIDRRHYNRIIAYTRQRTYLRDTWVHNPYHRRGVPYRNPELRARFRPNPPGSPASRLNYRGYQTPVGTPSRPAASPVRGEIERTRARPTAPPPGNVTPPPRTQSRYQPPAGRLAPPSTQTQPRWFHTAPNRPVQQSLVRQAQGAGAAPGNGACDAAGAAGLSKLYEWRGCPCGHRTRPPQPADQTGTPGAVLQACTAGTEADRAPVSAPDRSNRNQRRSR